MGQAQINVRTRACSRTSNARTKQAALTHNVRGKELNKLRVSYNNSCRRLLGLPMRNSASGMFVQCNLLSFGELLRKSIIAFRGRIQSSNNTIIKCMVNSVAPLVSNVWKWWRTTLYTGHVTV